MSMIRDKGWKVSLGDSFVTNNVYITYSLTYCLRTIRRSCFQTSSFYCIESQKEIAFPFAFMIMLETIFALWYKSQHKVDIYFFFTNKKSRTYGTSELCVDLLCVCDVMQTHFKQKQWYAHKNVTEKQHRIQDGRGGGGKKHEIWNCDRQSPIACVYTNGIIALYYLRNPLAVMSQEETPFC